MDKLIIKDVRGSLSEAQKSEIIELWKQGNAFTDIKTSNERLKEIFAISLNENGKIIAVSTVYQDIDPILKIKLHFIRAFVSETSREFKIGTEFIVFILNTLDKEYDPNNSDLPIGGSWVLENETVMANYKLAVSRHTKSVFYGYHHGVFPARVRFFSHAKIPA